MWKKIAANRFEKLYIYNMAKRCGKSFFRFYIYNMAKRCGKAPEIHIDNYRQL